MSSEICGVGPCTEAREAGRQFCPVHGPDRAREKLATREERDQRAADAADRVRLTARATGPRAIACPHCGERGSVSTRPVRVKKGVSGGKATGAILTLGWSLFATGLSRKEAATEMSCGNCGVSWLT